MGLLNAFWNWRHPQAKATGIVVARKVEWEHSSFLVLLDLHFSYEGRSHQARATAASFDDAERALTALAKWPIGSYQQLRFPPGRPHCVSVAPESW